MDLSKTMQQIIELRFSDKEETLSLCFELLAHVRNHPDSYLESFANTYIGDYYIVKGDSNQALFYLQKAKKSLESFEKNHKLMGTIYSFIGIALEMQGDEQNAILHYLEGMRIAKENKENYTESINLNNLAIIFQRHGHLEKALEYFLRANEAQKTVDYFPSRSLILCNIGDLYLQMDKTNEANLYYKLSEDTQTEGVGKDFLHHRNQCCYLAAINRKEEAINWARKILERSEFIREYQLFGAFDNFNMICLAMFRIKDKTYTYEFLKLMQSACQGNINELQLIEEYKLNYTLQFCSEDEHKKAYYYYYKKTKEFKQKINEDIAKSMKDKIHLHEILVEKRNLELEQKYLEVEVNLDELTGMYNRRYIEDLIKENNHIINKRLGIAMFDIDYFKEFNDAYGHGQGDEALRVVGECLKKFSNNKIHPCRYGGDEFICFFDNLEEKNVERYIFNVRDELYQRYVKHEYSPCSDRITLSVGLALENTGEINVYDVLNMADEALYESKASGRNSVKKKGA